MEGVSHLAAAERLEVVADHDKTELRQLPLQRPDGRKEPMVYAGRDHILKVLKPDLGIKQWRPGNGKRMHPVLVLQAVRNAPGVFAATARHDHIVVPVIPAVP